MSWQSLLGTDASAAALALDCSDGAWDTDLFSDVAALFGPQMGLTSVSDGEGEGDDESSDLMGDDDLAILNQLLHNAQQHDAARQQQQPQQPHTPAPESLMGSVSAAPVPAAAPISTGVVATPTALVTIPPPTPPTATAPSPSANTLVHTKEPAVTAAAIDLTKPDDEVLFTGKTTRERRKEELVFLRAKAQELETKLAKLKQQMAQQVSTDSQCTDLVAQQQPQSALSRYAALWMKLAKRQDDERRHALSENAKLRQLVVAQVRLARSLDRVLRKRMKHKTPLHDGESEGDTTEAER